MCRLEFSPKINKRVGSNKECRWENFLKKNKICCVLIREFRAGCKVNIKTKILGNDVKTLQISGGP